MFSSSKDYDELQVVKLDEITQLLEIDKLQIGKGKKIKLTF